MQGKSKKVLPVVLVIIIIGLVIFILINSGVINSSDTTKENNTKNTTVTNLDTDNANVKALIKQVHNPSQTIDELIFVSGGSLVSEMTEKYKFAIATNTPTIQLTTYSTPTEDGYYGEIPEEDVKDAYERLFGPGTYKATDSFTLGCMPVTYDSTNKRYVTSKDGCGVPTTPVNMQEEILDITKTDKKLTVLTAVLFYDNVEGNLYKDSNLTKKLETKADSELTDDNLKQYIKENKDQLEQYTYTFDIATDGFYYYTGVKRTQE